MLAYALDAPIVKTATCGSSHISLCTVYGKDRKSGRNADLWRTAVDRAGWIRGDCRAASTVGGL
jgi:hypothetical protein